MSLPAALDTAPGTRTYGHAVCGLRVLSTLPVPGLVRVGDEGPWDVVIRLGTLPDRAGGAAGEPIHVSAQRDAAGRPLLTARALGGGGFHLQYADGVEFVIDDAAARVWGRWTSPSTLDDAATYLVGPVLAFVLRRRGVTALHASAIALGERVVVLVGPAGAGKSTLAAAFAQRGHAVLADDVVALGRDRGRFVVQPGSPRIRLWPEAVTALYGAPDVLPRLTPTWDKRFLDVEQAGEPGGRRALPLAAIYVLDATEPGDVMPRSEALAPAEALIALVANTSVNYLLDAAMRRQEFRTLGELVEAVPVRRLRSPADAGVVPRLCQMIVAEEHARE